MRRSDARRLIDSGFRTLPLKPDSKLPYPGWPELIERATTRRDLEGWGADCNVGILPHGYIVIDWDHKETGHEFLRRHPIDTLIAETRRGLHVYLKGSAPNRIKLGGQPVDVIGQGKYVVAPASQVAGFTYRWLTDLRRPDELQAFDPDWFPALSAVRQPVRPVRGDRADPGRCFRYLDACPRSVSGASGHTTCYRVLTNLLRAMPGLSYADFRQAAHYYNATKCDHPHSGNPLSWIEHKIEDAWEEVRG